MFYVYLILILLSLLHFLARRSMHHVEWQDRDFGVQQHSDQRSVNYISNLLLTSNLMNCIWILYCRLWVGTLQFHWFNSVKYLPAQSKRNETISKQDLFMFDIWHRLESIKNSNFVFESQNTQIQWIFKANLKLNEEMHSLFLLQVMYYLDIFSFRQKEEQEGILPSYTEESTQEKASTFSSDSCERNLD